MLDTLSEFILSELIKLCKGEPDKDLRFTKETFNGKISESVLVSVLSDLEKDKYLESWSRPGYNNVPFFAKLTFKGYSYFERKQAENKRFFKRSILVPIVITLATQLILWAVAWLFGVIQDSKQLNENTEGKCHYCTNHITK